jgi:hypothetical protein
MTIPIVGIMTLAWFLILRPHELQGRVPVSNPSPAFSCGVERRTSFYFGVAPGDGWQGKLSRFDSAGLTPSLVEFYVRFGSAFDRVRYCQIARFGALPFIQINPRSLPVDAISQGKYDSWISSYARSVRAFGHTIALSFAPEMNGSWYSWGRPNTKPSDYIAAWRHIHELFARNRATNVIWIWDVDHCCAAHIWWPGAHYVDWAGIDGYLRPQKTFTGIFHHRIEEIRTFTTKPILLAEAAVAPGPERYRQITEVFAGIRRDHLLGFVWFDVNAKDKWRIDNDSAVLAAVRDAATTVRKVAK